MIQVFINDDEISLELLSYDEWFYHKYAEDKMILPFKLLIDQVEFTKIIKPRYELLIKDLLEDDLNSGDNFAAEVFEGSSDYPTLEQFLHSDDFKLEDKLRFFNDFLSIIVLPEYTSKQKQLEKGWVIRKVKHFHLEGDKINISGDVQSFG